MMIPSQWKKSKRKNNKSNSKQVNADPLEDGVNDGLDRMNLGETAQESESDSERLLAQIGKTRVQKKERTVLNVNITLYLIF